jgi:hypothetical protein
MTIFFPFHSQIYRKTKNIRREIKSVHWHLEVVLKRTCFAFPIKKGGIEEIKSA